MLLHRSLGELGRRRDAGLPKARKVINGPFTYRVETVTPVALFLSGLTFARFTSDSSSDKGINCIDYYSSKKLLVV